MDDAITIHCYTSGDAEVLNSELTKDFHQYPILYNQFICNNLFTA